MATKMTRELEGIEGFVDAYINDWFSALIPDERWTQLLVGMTLLVFLVLLVGWGVNTVLVSIMSRAFRAMKREHWFQALMRGRVFRRLTHLVVILVITANLTLLPFNAQSIGSLQRLFYSAGLILFFAAFNGMLRAIQETYEASTRAQTRSIKGYIELGRIVSWAICVILVFSVLIDRSPLLMLSGLGALSAVLLLVFKDTLLSLVASTQMTSNDMLRIGDWIEMPQAHADGYVVDIALHTVKVQNWDKTVTTIPTYKLFSESYRNWRHMFESGGRRIKRTLNIDAGTVRFLTDDEIGQLKHYRLLVEYLSDKENLITESNRQLGDFAAEPVNRRRLTNLGTFRAYALAYLRDNKELRQDMLMIVRMMEPGAEGIPIEVYCFSANTAWVEYERIQGDLFDHLIAVLPELSLRLYQSPTGADIAQGLKQR